MSKRDGAKIACAERSQKGDPKVSNILAVRAQPEKKGYEPLIILDASLVYAIDNQVVRQAPGACYDR